MFFNSFSFFWYDRLGYVTYGIIKSDFEEYFEDFINNENWVEHSIGLSNKIISVEDLIESKKDKIYFYSKNIKEEFINYDKKFKNSSKKGCYNNEVVIKWGLNKKHFYCFDHKSLYKLIKNCNIILDKSYKNNLIITKNINTYIVYNEKRKETWYNFYLLRTSWNSKSFFWKKLFRKKVKKKN